MLYFVYFLFFALNGCIFATCLTKKDRNHVYEEERREGFVHVLLDVRPEDLYISSDGEVLAKCRTSSVSRDGNVCIRINLSEEAHVHYLGEEISEREYKDAVSIILFDAACVLPSLKISE